LREGAKAIGRFNSKEERNYCLKPMAGKISVTKIAKAFKRTIAGTKMEASALGLSLDDVRRSAFGFV